MRELHLQVIMSCWKKKTIALLRCAAFQCEKMCKQIARAAILRGNLSYLSINNARLRTAHK
jgi:hypothetical protein